MHVGLAENALTVSHPLNACRLSRDFESISVSCKLYRSIIDCFTFSIEMIRVLLPVQVRINRLPEIWIDEAMAIKRTSVCCMDNDI